MGADDLIVGPVPVLARSPLSRYTFPFIDLNIPPGHADRYAIRYEFYLLD